MTTSSSTDYCYDVEEISDALWGLGLRYLRGDGVLRNVEECPKMLNESAHLGSPCTKRLLAMKYMTGSDGLPRDPMYSAFWKTEAEYQDLEADRFFEKYRFLQ